MTTNDIAAIRTDYDTREQLTDEGRRKSVRAFLADELVKHIPALCDEIEQLRAEAVAHQAEIARLRDELNTLGNMAYRGANPGGALDALAEIHHRAGHAVSGWASVSDAEAVSR